MQIPITRNGIMIIALALASCALILWKLDAPLSQNPLSRLATIDSLVHRGTYAIEHSGFRSIDSAIVGSHLVSTKPPMLPTIAGGFYWAFWKITGISFLTDNKTSVLFLRFLVGLVPHIILLLYSMLFLRLIIAKPIVRIWTFAALALSYVGVLYAADINNHTVAAAVLLMAFYYAFRIRHHHADRAFDWMMAGFLSGMVFTLDIPSLLFVCALGLYMFQVDRTKTLTLFAPACMVPIALHCFLMVLATGSVLPLQFGLQESIPHPAWIDPGGIDAANDPKWFYAFHVLVGHHGIFTITPVLILGLIEVVKQIREKMNYRTESLVVLIPTIILLSFYIAKTHNYSGPVVSLRWMIPVMPLLILFSGLWLQEHFSKRSVVLYGAFIAIGAYHVITTISPWTYPQWFYLFGVWYA